MKILLIAPEPALRQDGVVSGNALRAHQLTAAVEHAGHRVRAVWLAGPGQARDADSFRNRDELQGLILRHAPDLLLVTYWELLGLLPFESAPPVILDFVAPRLLEQLFEAPAGVVDALRRLRVGLGRCDLVLTGNERQGRLLVHDLLGAGLDLRAGCPVIAVPPGAEPAPATARRPGAGGWTLAAGGVTWPWRNERAWLSALAAAVRQGSMPGRLVHHGGTYRWHGNGASPAPPAIPGVEHRSMLPYRDYREFLARDAHIGIDLADGNVEREYSQSFRLLEFLRHGLPVICNRYLPIAPLIEEYRAGWPVDSPEELGALWQSIANDPAGWEERSAGALRLVAERLHPVRSAGPLLHWLQDPRRAARLPGLERRPAPDPVLGVPPLRERLRRQLGLARRVALRRRLPPRSARSGVLFVTRADLFPADHGAAVRTVETARALGDLGVRTGIVTDHPGHWYEYRQGEFQPRPYPFLVRWLRWPGPLLKLRHYSKDLPHNNAFLYLPLTDGGFRRRILAAARMLGPAVLQAEFPAYAEPCLAVREILECPVVLVEHNVEFERLRRQVAELTRAQYLNLRAIEIDLCRRVDAVVCVSDNDRQTLAEEGVDPGRLHLIPHGVNLARFEAPALSGMRERCGIGPADLVLAFHGTFSYPPNRTAITILAGTLLPALEQRGIQAHVLAIGRDPPAVKLHPRVHFTGAVAELGPWLKLADLAVVPLVDGGGTRMKIIDCFAAGLPVISTAKGIEGIPVESGRDAFVSDDWEEMTDAIVRLWNHPEERQELARRGRAIAAELDWSRIGARFRELYARLA